MAPWDPKATPGGRTRRDHGALWGRPGRVDSQSATSIATTYATAEFAFTRTLELSGPALHAHYNVRNQGSRPLPFMWALHGLLAVTPDDRIELPGLTAADATYLSHHGRTLVVPKLRWPGPDPALGLALDRVHPASEQFAGKLYASGIDTVRVGNARGALEIASSPEVQHLGIWLNYGGWPGPDGIHHVALESTTAPVDHLGQALERGPAVTLAPGASQRWSVTLTCTEKLS